MTSCGGPQGPVLNYRVGAAAIGALAVVGLSLPAQARDYNFSVVNFTDLNLGALYISPSDSDSWGDNRLPSTLVEANGGEQTVTISTPDESCYYDIQGIFSETVPPPDDAPDITLWAVDLCDLEQQGGLVFFHSDLYKQADNVAPDGTAAALEASESELIRVVNNSRATLLGLLVNPAGANAVPVDLLGNTYLGPGEYAAVVPSVDTSAGCNFDLTAYFTSDESALGSSIATDAIDQKTLDAVDLCRDKLIFTGEEPTTDVVVENTTSMVLSELYLSPTNDSDWGIDQLIYELLPGDNAQIALPVSLNPDGTCQTYDVLGIFYQGSDSTTAHLYEDGDIALCDTETVTLDFSKTDLFYEEAPAE